MVAVAGKKFHQIIRAEVANMSKEEKEVLRYSSATSIKKMRRRSKKKQQ